MTCKQASYSPGLSSVKSQKSCPGTHTRSWDEFSSLSLGISKTLQLSSVLANQPVTELSQISPKDPQDRLGSKKPQSRAAPCKPISDLVASYSGMAGDPKEAHHMPVRDIIQRCLVLTINTDYFPIQH